MRLKIPRWEGIRKIGQLRIMALTMIVPVIGYMIIFNENIIQLFELSKEVFTELVPGSKSSVQGVSGDSKTRLYYFYFGLTFLGTGSIIYQIFCPGIIKEHGSDRQYIREEAPLITLKRFESLLDALEGITKKQLIDFKERLDMIQTFSPGAEEKARMNMTTDLFIIQWRLENESYFVIRVITFLLYMVGFGFLAIPSIQMFGKVFVAFMS